MKKTTIAAASPRLALMNPMENARRQIECARKAAGNGAALILFPRKSICGATASPLCGDFLQRKEDEALNWMTEQTEKDPLLENIYIFTGGKRQETDLVCIYRGQLLDPVDFDCIFYADSTPALAGNKAKRREQILEKSLEYTDPVVYANANMGESTADGVYDGYCVIAQCGRVMAESAQFEQNTIVYAEIDEPETQEDTAELWRRQDESIAESLESWVFDADAGASSADDDDFEDASDNEPLVRNPWLPADPSELKEFCKEAIDIQAAGLAERLTRSHSQRFVIGVSGGSDSTLALLASTKALEKLGKGPENIIAVTMPGFGSSSRTRTNADIISETLGCTHYDISIVPAVEQHFRDIGQDPKNYDACYENAQARERTQILMDLANMHNGLVVGTGDMSELALGWCTYNGDHMSMYCANGGLTKTAVRACIAYAKDEILAGNWPLPDIKTAEKIENTRGMGADAADQLDATLEKGARAELAAALQDILDTPISPELLPTDENGQIAQVTEDKIGPYELHDFYLYHFMSGKTPSEILEAAEDVFCKPAGSDSTGSDFVYNRETVKKWLRTFIWRFFSQQFKRSCMPEGPQILKYSLSPRGGLIFPSDSDPGAFLEELG